jgi:hypothetical protein
VRYPRRLRLGAAIQLGFVRMTGTTLNALDNVPTSLLEYVAHQLMLPAPELATLRALYRNERTRFAHQAWACACAGLRWPEQTDVAPARPQRLSLARPAPPMRARQAILLGAGRSANRRF